LNPDLIQDLIPGLMILDLKEDLIPELITDLIPDLEPGLMLMPDDWMWSLNPNHTLDRIHD